MKPAPERLREDFLLHGDDVALRIPALPDQPFAGDFRFAYHP